MAYSACTSEIKRNIQQDCSKPLVGGYTGLCALIPVDSNYSVEQDATNPRKVVAINCETDTVVVVDNLSVNNPFDGSTSASSADAGVREFTKTLAFRIPQRGADVSKDIVEALCNSRGVIAVAEKTDNRADGKYEVIGLLQPLKVTEDGVSRTEAENGGAIMMTMQCTEPWFELNLVGEGGSGATPEYTLAGAKAAFNAIIAKAV